MSDSWSIMENFDQLSEMAKHDPEAFEVVRKQIISNEIGRLPEARKRNMQRFQWRIDQEANKHAEGLGRCMKLTGLMWSNIDNLKVQLDFLMGSKADPNAPWFLNSEEKVVSLSGVRSF